MKKLFIVLAVASLGFVACNNESKSDADDAAKKAQDSARVADSLAKLNAPAADTTHHDSTSKMAPDSSKKAK